MSVSFRTRRQLRSLPARGGWIEILSDIILITIIMSLPARGGWIEISRIRLLHSSAPSLPARGGWIEICRQKLRKAYGLVPPRTGRVD